MILLRIFYWTYFSVFLNIYIQETNFIFVVGKFYFSVFPWTILREKFI